MRDWLRAYPWAAACAWGIFLATRLPVAVAGSTPEGVSVWWVFPGPGGMALGAAACLAGALAGVALLWPLQVAWLCRRGLGTGGARRDAARAWLPGLALLLVPALELAAPLYGLTLGPLALGQVAWPALGLAALLATLGLTLRAAPAPLAPAPGPGSARAAWLVFLAALVVFGALWGRLVWLSGQYGPIVSGDEPRYLLIAHSLAVDHDIDLADNLMLREGYHFSRPGTLPFDHQHWTPLGLWSKFRPGVPALIAPFYAWGLWQGWDVHHAARLLSLLMLAWLAAEVFLLCRELTGRGDAAWWAAAAAMGLPFFSYSTLIFPEAPAAALTLAAFRRLGPRRGREWPQLLLAGLAAAYLGWLHERLLVVAVSLGLLALLRRPWRDWRGLIAFWLPPAASAGLMGLYFQLMYGRPLPSAGDHAKGVFLNLKAWWEGLVGLWIDGAEGLLPYAPLLLAGLAGLVWLVRRRPREGLAALLVAGPIYVVCGLFAEWHGGGISPARYMVVVSPFLALGVGCGAAWGGRRFRLAALFLGALELAVMALYWLYPQSFYGHRATLDAFNAYPLFLRWLPTFIMSHHDLTTNLGLAAVWGGLALLVVVWLQAPAPGGGPWRASLALAGGLLAVMAAAGLSDALGLGVARPAGPDQVRAQWQALAGLPARPPVWRAGPAPGPPRGALTLTLTPARFAHGPLRRLRRPAGAVEVPAGFDQGDFIYGQYLALPPGSYRAEADVSAACDPHARDWFEVSAAAGHHRLARDERTWCDPRGPRLLEFTTRRGAREVELRLGTNGVRAVRVEGLRLERVLE